jgi:hypothetical protein
LRPLKLLFDPLRLLAVMVLQFVVSASEVSGRAMPLA